MIQNSGAERKESVEKRTVNPYSFPLFSLSPTAEVALGKSIRGGGGCSRPSPVTTTASLIASLTTAMFRLALPAAL
ncbi:hypothetical protein E2C01_051333 [Portunus trituberculatus]|uniref:Uncharacterized protein n=1 Tax=Portunus trituberculatus TaxID=210409 RepID=A0A5B7GLI4_PORTR|nr:hypothetical protein [Portunus trituberculatus]